MTIQDYIEKISKRYATGISTEHSYRGDLQSLLETLASDVLVTNEPARIACGAPDYIITKRNIPVGYIEAKDIGADLNNKAYKEQFDRYRQSLNNLIITDYLTFHLYIDSALVTTISIGDIHGNKVISKSENFSQFSDLIKNFCAFSGQTIKSASKLSKMMAGKARLLANVIEKALDPKTADDQVNEPQNINLHNQFESFKQILIHDITPKAFADIYAQTIAYGMFAARLHDPSLDNFSRQEAAELIPKSNPFLRKLFQYVAGYDLDDRIKWIVDALADIFRSTNISEILKDFGKSTQQQDPFIHFYETFLAEYDPALRKSRGVWYTPEPVVNFIVRAVDDILKSEFDLPQGLADTSKIKIEVPVQGKMVKQDVHRVQIFDPAAGTGTFLAEVIKQIYKKFEGQQGIWNNYVEEHLIPRLNGFEILMASYAMAHLKLDMLLTDTGFKSTKEQRFRVYLTNSLEEHHPDTGTLFANWLSTEANEANHVKRDTPVMVVLGNPPYSGESSNKGRWIMDLMEDYKKEPGGKEKLNERNPKWINDDYVKFIRYGQHFIEKNGEGILAFINPHGFLDNPTFRGMRWNLLKAYDKIYTLDLHGNSKKKETAQDGTVDMNVFDIMQGVSINIFVKTGKKKVNELGKVYQFDLFGKREMKYDFLFGNSLVNIEYKELPNVAPNYFFVGKNFEEQKVYNEGFSIDELFILNNVGVVTSRDSFVIDDDKAVLEDRLGDFFKLTKEDIQKKYKLKENGSWKINEVKQKAIAFAANSISKLSYRPFDTKYIYYNNHFIERSRNEIMQHFLKGDNIGIDLCRQLVSEHYTHIFITNKIVDDSFVSNKTRERGYVFPLFRYTDTNGQQSIDQSHIRSSNLNQDIVKRISDILSLTFECEKSSDIKNFTPFDVFDYIYAVLHSPNYREKYKEFLKIDFPRVPYPKDKEKFWQLVKLGSQLRQIHLMDSPVVEKFITTYPISGSNEVVKTKYEAGKVWINDDQYFDHVPQVAWEFFIGGYQPAQKWLKDRKGRILSFEDILHYQKIIVALNETDRIMKEIDDINFINE